LDAKREGILPTLWARAGRQPGWLPCHRQWVLAGERRNGRRSGRARGRAERDPKPCSARHSEMMSVAMA